MTSGDFLNFALGSSAVITALGTFVMSWLNLRKSAKIEAQSDKIVEHTNSMKDALVKATGIAAHAEGKEEGRQEGEVKAASLAKGQLRPRD